MEFCGGANWQDNNANTVVEEHRTITESTKKFYGCEFVICLTAYGEGEVVRKWRCGHSTCNPSNDEMVRKEWCLCTCRRSRRIRDVPFKGDVVVDTVVAGVVDVGTPCVACSACSGGPAVAAVEEDDESIRNGSVTGRIAEYGNERPAENCKRMNAVAVSSGWRRQARGPWRRRSLALRGA